MTVTTKLTSVCPLDCPDACTLTVDVEDGRVARLDGGEKNPVTQGYICGKVRRFPKVMYDTHRMLRPAVRVGPKGEGIFHDVSWDEALNRITERLAGIRDGAGAEAILPFCYGGSNGLLSQDTLDARFFRRLGASNLARTVCAMPTGVAAMGLYGKMAGVSYEDYPEAKLILIWGVNPAASGIHLMPYLLEAQKRGAKLAVIDPRRTKLAARADLHLPIRPGTDVAVALAMIHRLFESGTADLEFLDRHATDVSGLRERAAAWPLDRAAEVAGVTPEAIESLLDLYVRSNPAVIRAGWGMERNRNGGSSVASVLALPAVAGKFGVRGGGYTLSNSGVWDLDASRAAATQAPGTRTVNMNRLGAALTTLRDPAVEALFVYNCNPLTTMPNQEAVRRGLEREDLFTVVFDSFLTDTAAYADVLLPACTFLERREIAKGYGAYAIQEAHPVVEPVGESRTNHAVFLELCRRMDLTRPGDPETEDAVRDAIFSGETTRPLRDGLVRDGVAHPGFGTRPVQFVDVFPRTPDRKIHLLPPALDAEAPEGLYGYRNDPGTAAFPLALISPATSRTINSTLGQLETRQVPLRIHPADAEGRGIAAGENVRVWNDLGEIRCHVEITTDLRPGVVELAKGIWAHNTLSGTTANAVAPDSLTDLGGGACFNDARVQVAAVRSADGPA